MYQIKDGQASVCGIPICTTDVHQNEDWDQQFQFSLVTKFHGTVTVSVSFGRSAYADNPGNHPNSVEAEVWCSDLDIDTFPFVPSHRFSAVVEQIKNYV